ncbi:pleiotropic drug resistance 11 [Actinidia rufa]|uniref:Pleiotropic drug resistance 11 n=1 Tax=Actinidia rufa TaxID=165716 RepID=A0A7J0FIR9_9ERIC|nr:pleiotropic drug resistance 11 [Actinidia rufa]
MASALAGDDLTRSTSSRRSMAAMGSRRSWASGSFREVWQVPPDVFHAEREAERRRGRGGAPVGGDRAVTDVRPPPEGRAQQGPRQRPHHDNDKFLRRLRDRTDRVGIEIPKIEVRYEHLSIEGDVYVGSRALPTLFNSTMNTIETVLGLIRLAPSKKRKIQILKDVTGVVKPSRMTLLLGPPGAGKTTLLLALAGKLDGDLRVSGNITYCGHELSEFVPQRTCAYISQHDLHYGEMTVRETLDFSGRCLGVGTRYEMLVELSKREKEAGIKPDPEIDAFMKATAVSGQETSLVTDYVLKLLGLDICADIMVGDEMRRGISGGQKKRVTTGIWIILTYYTIGFAPAASRFFRQFIAFFGIHQMALSLFRFIAAVGRTQVVASTLGTFTLLMVFVLGGFIVAKNDIEPFMIWGYYLSPMMYGQNAIVMNEFLDKRWSTPNTDPRIDAPTVGKVLLKSRGFYTDDYMFWVCVVALLAFSLIFNILFIAALTYLNPFGDSKAVILDEEGENKNKKSSGQTTSEGIDMAVRNASHGSDSIVRENAPKNGMVLPFQPLSLGFNHVNYSVDMPAEMKSQGVEEDRLQLLRDVSGAFRPGILTALVGVSGAGKTTLMDVLAGRKTGGYIEGSISISGYPKNQETFARISGYCEQNDIHSPYVTVYESLLYSAWLRLSSDVNTKTRKMFVEEVMELVELNPIRNFLVGLPGVDGLSTEQRKRLTIAVELVANPSIIFMDEPTSGLDARAAAIVMRTVRNTVDTGRTVLLLMKRGGQVIYAGPLGHHSHKLVEYFEAVPGVPKIRDGYNPATWMLEVSAALLSRLNWKSILLIFTPTRPFIRQQTTKQQDLMNLLGAMYAAVLFLGATNAASVAIEAIYVIIQTFVYSLLLYTMIGFEWKVAKVLWFYYLILMCFIYFTLYGMMVVALTPGHQIAAIVMSFFLSFWNLFSGFLIPRTQIPIWWRWYYWASPVAWTLYGLVTSQVGDKSDELEIPGARNVPVKAFIKSYMGFDYDFLPAVAVAHVGFVVLFFFVFAYGIKFLNFQRR